MRRDVPHGFGSKRDSASPHAMGFLAARTWPSFDWDDERRAGPGIARPHSPPTKLSTAVRREPAANVEISGVIMREVLGVGIRGRNSGARDAHTALGLPAGLTRGALSGRTEFGGVARRPRVKPAGRAVPDRGQSYGAELNWFQLAPLGGEFPHPASPWEGEGGAPLLELDLANPTGQATAPD
ncbi:hypothetical protein ABIB57_004964 [Devosia sp. UYZn731]